MNDPDRLRRVLTHLEKAQEVAHLGSWEAVPRNEPGEDWTPTIYWSPQAYEIAGWPRDRMPSLEEFVDLVHPDDRDAFLAMRTEALAGRAPYAIDLRLVRPDGELRHVHVAARVERDAHGALRRVIGTVQDRTSEVRSRARLAEAEEARRRLLRQVLSAAERERASLATALDTRAIATIGPLLDELRRRIADARLPADAAGAAEALHDAEQSLRSLVSGMVPDAGTTDLTDALLRLARSATFPVDVSVEPSVNDIAPSAVLRTLLRIAQEALHNAHKHSGASSVSVVVDRSGRGVRLRVLDDGRGFDPDQVVREPGHLGMAAMRERAEAVGGTLHITSAPGRTQVCADLPLC